MPHGKIVLFPALILTIAATFSMLTLVNCSFVETTIVDDNQSYYPYSESAGFWPDCVYVPYYIDENREIELALQDDPGRKVAMSFGLIACMVGTGAMTALWPITCKAYSANWIWIICSIVVAAFFSQLVTFSMFGTDFCKDFGCRLSWGGAMSIIAAILWLVGAIGVWKIPEPVDRSDDDNVTIQMNESIQPDGTKIIEKITTNINGTKTIERTIERAVGVERPLDTASVSVDQAVTVETEP